MRGIATAPGRAVRFLAVTPSEINERFSLIERVKEIFEAEAAAVRNIPITECFAQAVEIIHRQVHEKGGKLVTSGMGKAGEIAGNIATTFSSTGTPAAYLHPSEAQHGDLGILQKNDVMLVISNSGKTREIVELIELKNCLYADIPVIVITSQADCPLAPKAQCVILTGAPAEVCTLGLTPTTSTTVMTVIGDALVVLLMEKIKFSVVDYAKRHHGGYLGTKSRSISEQGHGPTGS